MFGSTLQQPFRYVDSLHLPISCGQILVSDFANSFHKSLPLVSAGLDDISHTSFCASDAIYCVFGMGIKKPLNSPNSVEGSVTLTNEIFVSSYALICASSDILYILAQLISAAKRTSTSTTCNIQNIALLVNRKKIIFSVSRIYVMPIYSKFHILKAGGYYEL